MLCELLSATRASLCPSGTKKLTKHLVSEGVLQDGDQICDFGSSYGSLLLNIVNYSVLKITGYGIEQARMRHDLYKHTNFASMILGSKNCLFVIMLGSVTPILK